MKQAAESIRAEAKRKNILVPVFGSVNAAEVARTSFWLARDEPSRLIIVEVIAPPTFFRWLAAPLTNLFKSDKSRRLREVRRMALKHGLACEISEKKAPSLLLGIVEAARNVNPDSVVLALDLRKRLKSDGINELKHRLSEIGTFMLFLAEQGPAMRVEPCHKKGELAQGRVTSIKRHV